MDTFNSNGMHMAQLPKQINDKWHKLAQQMIQMNGSCIDIAHNADDPDGDVHRYCYFKTECTMPDAVLLLANKMRLTAAGK